MWVVAAAVNVNVDTGDMDTVDVDTDDTVDMDTMDTVDVDTDDTVDVVLLSQVISVDISHLSARWPHL